MATGPYRAVEELAERSLRISEEALRSDCHALDQSIYLLWDGEKIARRPVVPEIVSESPMVSNDELLLAEAEAILGLVHDLGLRGVSRIESARVSSGIYYVVCVVMSDQPLSAVLKFAFDQEDLVRLTMDQEDWLHLHKTFFAAPQFRVNGAKEVRVLPIR